MAKRPLRLGDLRMPEPPTGDTFADRAVGGGDEHKGLSEELTTAAARRQAPVMKLLTYFPLEDYERLSAYCSAKGFTKTGVVLVAVRRLLAEVE